LLDDFCSLQSAIRNFQYYLYLTFQRNAKMSKTGAGFNLMEFSPPTEARLRIALDLMTRARVLVVGDLCLDIYWFVNSSGSERSLETGLPTNPVQEQRYSLGGAGNVAHNVAAAGCRNVRAVGVIGDDPWGREMVRLLRSLGIQFEDVWVQHKGWATLAYNKPHLDGRESNRFDFGNFNELSSETARDLLLRCRAIIPESDVVIVNQQVRQGIHTKEFRDGLAALIREFPDRIFVVDSRHFSDAYAGVHMKLNNHEAARLCGMDRAGEEPIAREEIFHATQRLYARFGKPVYVTCGSRGMVIADRRGLWELPGVRIHGQVDTVGAGDSALAGIGLALAAGCDAVEAGHFGNLLAAVTIQKLSQTGTASPKEILAMSRRYLMTT
jgi:rfaE bifunctional protein kinase chain/domain